MVAMAEDTVGEENTADIITHMDMVDIKIIPITKQTILRIGKLMPLTPRLRARQAVALQTVIPTGTTRQLPPHHPAVAIEMALDIANINRKTAILATYNNNDNSNMNTNINAIKSGP